MDTVKRWKVYCDDEAAWFDVWKETKPTACPNNSRHAVDPTKTYYAHEKVAQDVNPVSVSISSKNYGGTEGYYIASGVSFDVPDASVEFQHTLTLDVMTCIYGVRLHRTEQSIMHKPFYETDTISVSINPNTAAGVVTSAASIGDTVIGCSDTVIKTMFAGFYISFSGTSTQYRITNISVDNSTFTITPPLEDALLGDGSVVIYATIYMVKDVPLGIGGHLEFGYGTLGGKQMPAATDICVTYKRPNGSGTSSGVSILAYMETNY